MRGSVGTGHNQAYFDEEVFCFNCRNARHRGLLFQRLLRQAVTYKLLCETARTRPASPRSTILNAKTGPGRIRIALA